MKKQYLFMALGLLLMACKPIEPTPTPNPGENPGDTTPVIIPDPEGTIYYTETDELFTNPERGFYLFGMSNNGHGMSYVQQLPQAAFDILLGNQQ